MTTEPESCRQTCFEGEGQAEVEDAAKEPEITLADLADSIKHPGWRTYRLEFQEGQWVFRRDELDEILEAAIDEIFGPKPEE